MNDSRTETADSDGKKSPSQGFREAISQLAELKQYVRHYLSAHLDIAKLSIRNAIIWLAIGLLAMIAGFALIVTAVVIICTGLSGAIGALLGGRPWAGNLIVGIAILAAAVIGIWLGVKRLFGASLTKTVERYERKLRRQRIELGHDARERSAEYDAE